MQSIESTTSLYTDPSGQVFGLAISSETLSVQQIASLIKPQVSPRKESIVIRRTKWCHSNKSKSLTSYLLDE